VSLLRRFYRRAFVDPDSNAAVGWSFFCIVALFCCPFLMVELASARSVTSSTAPRSLLAQPQPAPQRAAAPRAKAAVRKVAAKVAPRLPVLLSAAPVVEKSQNDSVPILDPNKATHPRSSMHDFSNLLDAPAGKYGFLQVKNSHFVWPNGKRARFWGINIANTSLQESEADIDAMIENFRTAGFNLIRLHHFDERGGIIDLGAPDSRRFIPERLKKLDYWIYKAKQAGMYVYLDLLDYRRFKAGDGVINSDAIGRAARPYAVFDRRLIELQKEYALNLMKEHVNSYTGLSYAKDPAIVMLEIYDESGLFMRRGVWRTMPEPYATNFKQMWNDWLREQYKNTAALAAAWTDGKGVSALTQGESLENGTVQLPAMSWTNERLPVEQQKWATPPRRNDGARFAYTVHKKYFIEMREYLRDIGIRIPVTATGRFEDLADLKSMSEELDFIGCNFYYDHPYWGTGAPAWQPPSYFHNNNPMSHIDERSMAAAMSLSRIKDKPFVVREWNYCWPNRNRSAGIIEAASFAALHDIDAMILFVYETRPTARVSYFNVRSDPSRWGLVGVGAEIFLKELIKPSQHKIVIPYNTVDTFNYTRYHQPFYALGWATRVENDFYDGDVYKVEDGSGTDLILSPGRSGIGRYEGAPAVLHTSSLWRDLSGRTVTTPQYLAEYGLTTKDVRSLPLNYNGILYDQGLQQARKLWLGLPMRRVQDEGYEPIGTNAAADVANGFVDHQRRRFVFGNLDEYDVLRAALDAMSEFHKVPNYHQATEQNVFSTDTGEIRRDAASGRLIVSAPEIQALCGNLSGVGRVLAPGLRAKNMKNGTLIALALDGKPLVQSRRFMIKMVTDARNVDEVSGRDGRFLKNPQGQWKLDVLGEGPVTTGGKSGTVPIQIAIERRPLLDIYLEQGGFELLVDGDKWKFYCDTPGVRFAVHSESQQNGAPSWQQVSLDGVVSNLDSVRNGTAVTALFPNKVAVVRSAGWGEVTGNKPM